MARSQVPGRISAAMETTRLLRLARRNADRAMIEHAKQCYSCSKAISITGGYCDEGWILAKKRARAIYNWDNRARITANQNSTDKLF